MKNTTGNKIIITIMGILGIIGLVLICISTFGNLATNLPLTGGLACVGIAGILNTVYLVKNRKESKNWYISDPSNLKRRCLESALMLLRHFWWSLYLSGFLMYSFFEDLKKRITHIRQVVFQIFYIQNSDYIFTVFCILFSEFRELGLHLIENLYSFFLYL